MVMVALVPPVLVLPLALILAQVGGVLAVDQEAAVVAVVLESMEQDHRAQEETLLPELAGAAVAEGLLEKPAYPLVKAEVAELLAVVAAAHETELSQVVMAVVAQSELSTLHRCALTLPQ